MSKVGGLHEVGIAPLLGVLVKKKGENCNMLQCSRCGTLLESSRLVATLHITSTRYSKILLIALFDSAISG